MGPINKMRFGLAVAIGCMVAALLAGLQGLESAPWMLRFAHSEQGPSEPPTIQSKGPGPFAFSADGSLLAGPITQGKARVRELATGRTRLQIPGAFGGKARQIVFSPDASTVAVVRDNSVQLWDMVSGDPRITLADAHGALGLDALFSPDGATLATRSEDGRLSAWDARTGKLRKTFTPRAGEIRGYGFGADGETLVVGDQAGRVRFRALAARPGASVHNSVDIGSPVVDLVLSPDRLQIAVIDEAGRITLIETATGKILGVLEPHDRSDVVAVAFSRDGALLASGSSDAQLRLWDARSGELLATMLGDVGASVTDLAFSPDGRLLASAGQSERIFLWRTADGGLDRTLAGHEDTVLKLAFSTRRNILTSVGAAGKFIVWDLDTGRPREGAGRGTASPRGGVGVGSGALPAAPPSGVRPTAPSAVSGDVAPMAGPTCPCTIWPSTATPALLAANDSSAVEVGVKFRADSNGYITGIRFYKGSGNTGTHVGHLWTTGGNQLASVTFTSETATGWQQANFTTPVAITANTVYVASYFAPNGHYSGNAPFFASAGVDNAPLHALQNNVSGPNGVYVYTATGGFPTQTFNSANYWVDVVYDTTLPADTTPPVVSTTIPVSNAGAVGVAKAVTVTFNESIDPATISGSTFTLQQGSDPPMSASVTYSPASRRATLTPSAPLSLATTYTATVKGGGTDPRVKDLAGNALQTDYTWTFTTASTDVCASPPNEVFAENCKTGSPAAEWDVSAAGDLTIQGFASGFSVNRGETVTFKINTNAASYLIDIYRIGYYDGDGARKVATIQPSATLPQTQPACLSDGNTGLVDCGNWAASATWAVPTDAVSGVYMARPVRADTGGASHIVFIVRDDGGQSDLVFQTSDTTWQAYNNYGGNSLYEGAPAGRAYKVSYNRPFLTRKDGALPTSGSWLFALEYPLIRWLEANAYDVSYISGIDADRYGSELLEHKVFLSVGHDEYWSGPQRANVEAARDAGVHLAFFSGNEIFWKTRWEPSIDGSNTSYRTLVSYKETHANAKIDPTSAWTGTWRDPRFSPPADGGRPENALTGTIFTVNCCSTASAETPLAVPEALGKLRLWRNTSIATLAPNQVATLPIGVLGPEFDEALNNGFQPPGLIKLSTTTVSVPYKLLDYGSSYGPGTATHNLTLYRHGSGALVFGAGSMRWSWGLDGNHDYDPVNTPNASHTADVRMQQAMVNLFADMGAQPASLQSGLVTASASSDTTPPASTIVTPANGATVNTGNPVTISGTATDSGGVVAGVEVSVDGGTTWQPATGNSNWTYSWIFSQTGSVTVKSRAIDDSGNVQGVASQVDLTITDPPPSSCPCTLWPATTVPAVVDFGATSPIELGVKFRSDSAGTISGVRFYKAATNTGTHTAHLWSSAGVSLATATFTGETSSGWQQVNFSSPVTIQANTTYVVSYHTNVGHFSFGENYFLTQGRDNPPLHALSNTAGGGNGVYAFGSSSVFPTQTYNALNAWVDVVFNSAGPDTTPPSVASTSPASAATNVSPTAAITVNFNESMSASTINTQTVLLTGPGNTSVTAAVSYNSGNNAATLTPGGQLAYGTSYTVTVKGGGTDPRVKDAAGNAMVADYTWSFTTLAAPNCPCSLWTTATTPATAAFNDPASIEVGVKFSSDIPGQITGLRFYKGTGNTGTHVAHLWTSTGTLLATATFTNETATGWQTVTFSPAVTITANTTYVASYFLPNGHYAGNAGYFATAGYDNGPLHAPRDGGAAGSNGVYIYSATGAFPTFSTSSPNFWVDVLFSYP